jgi:Na+/H+ antiporter NhaD/arsenite permease-like protein
MLTPVGNPQNLYLYSKYNIPIEAFLKITFPYTVVSFILLCITIFLIKKEPLSFELPQHSESKSKSTFPIVIYGILFLVCLACVLRFFDYRITFLTVLITVALLDWRVLKKVDYALLMTFVFFFLFVGNMSSLPAVKDFLAELLSKKELPVSIAASQVISNVPAAVLLSAFTDNYKALILGTDIGGLGSLVASLASLISYKIYSRTEDADSGKFHNSDAVKTAVIEGIGISVISQRAVIQEAADGDIVIVPIDLNFMRSFKLVYHKNKFITPFMKNFMKLCLDSAHEYVL